MRRQVFADCGIQPRPMRAPECNALWARYKAGELTVQQLAVELMPLALHAARRRFQSRHIGAEDYGIDGEDVFGLAYVALVYVIERHDDSRSSIKTQVTTRIPYRVEDELRSAFYTSRFAIKEDGFRRKLSIETRVANDSRGQAMTIEGFLYSTEGGGYHVGLEDLLDELRPYATDQEFRVLVMHACFDYKMREVGEIVGLSESRVCQLIRRVRIRAQEGLELDFLDRATLSLSDVQKELTELRSAPTKRQRKHKRPAKRQLAGAAAA